MLLIRAINTYSLLWLLIKEGANQRQHLKEEGSICFQMNIILITVQ
jgi:hypothetical protein